MMTLIAHEKNDIIASETNHENDRYSILKFQIFSVINLFKQKKNHRDIESIWSVDENEHI